MITAYFNKTEPYHYVANKIGDFKIWLLYNLFDDFSAPQNAFSVLIEELIDENATGIYGNLSFCSINGRTISIYDIWDDEKRTLTINRAYLLELAKKWHELSEKGVPIITIKRDGETFTIEEGKEE